MHREVGARVDAVREHDHDLARVDGLDRATDQTSANDAIVPLTGQAYDDHGRELTGRRLTWFDGRRQIATGEQASATGLRPGRRTLRLVARDGSGRVGSTRVPIRMVAAPPVFLNLRVLGRISPRARSVTVRAGSTVAGVLRVSNRRFAVSRRVRSFRVRVRPGRGTLTLTLRLTAGRRTTAITQRIQR